MADQDEALFRANANILRLLDRFSARTAAARAAVRRSTDERADVARRLRADGLTVRQIALRLDRTERHVYRLLQR